VPDFRQIEPEALAQPRALQAIDFRGGEQLALVDKLASSYGPEMRELANLPDATGFDFFNPYFKGFDAAVYFSLVRELKPKKIIEIGAGFSTQIATLALQRNTEQGHTSELLTIEPYPEARLLESNANFQLIEKSVQDLPLDFFGQLGAGDILFIDSSHVAATGSDVVFELLEIMPQLKPGVWIHIHDIFTPRDYPAEWVLERRIAFNEQYMLEAFLMFNSEFTVKMSNAWIVQQARESCQQLFSAGNLAESASSFWIRKNSHG